MYYEVYLFDAPYHIDRPFDYFSEEAIPLGSIVKVPFGRSDRLRFGIVTREKPSPDSEKHNIKPVHSVIDGRYSLGEEMLGLCRFLKEYTLCTFGEAARCILPPGSLSDKPNIRYRKTVTLGMPMEEALMLVLKNVVKVQGQKEVLYFLFENGSADIERLRELPGVRTHHIRALEERGIIKTDAVESIRNPYAEYSALRDTSPINLSPAQATAYETVEKLYLEDGARAALLYGVTGSGKTKVIMRAIDRVIADGKSVIMLVPEISLTPQTVNIFCRRYGERVAVVHSSLSEGERLDAFRRVKRGEVDLVIGTRSAIFSPLENLGMIVIDEEHEHTYKSESDPKYHARDVAAYRCGKAGALMLLASATPSLESFHKAEEGKYTLVPLRERYGGAKLPTAVIVDMREELRRGNTSPVSDRLHKELSLVYENEKQAILFLNRRGYSSEVSCRACGEVLSCPRCSVSLTHHVDVGGGKLLCHLCGYSEKLPRSCPSCSSDKLTYLGYGTQKLEGEIGRFLPDMRLMRMDADTTQGKLAYDRMLEEFRSGEADILLGTQMVAKGHDFPRVTLVGVALADTSLFISDFRASERTFSLLTQVIGRAGRSGDEGIAVIQTYAPKNEVIRLACLQDYDRFYEGEIAVRRELCYPPFCDMVSLTLTADNENTLKKESEHLSGAVISRVGDKYSDLPFTVFGPFEAGIYKLNDKFRMRMVIKCKLTARSRRLFHEILTEFAPIKEVSLAVDLNPLTV